MIKKSDFQAIKNQLSVNCLLLLFENALTKNLHHKCLVTFSSVRAFVLLVVNLNPGAEF